MSDAAKDAAVLQPARIGAAGEALRRRLDRRHLFGAVIIALLFHLLIIFGFWLLDRIRVRDIGEWSGPVLVKIGVPEAPESPEVDPGPLPDQPEQPEEVSPPDTPETVPETVEDRVEENPVPVQPDSAADSTPPAEETPKQDEVVPERPQEPAPKPARVRGEESGNSYEMNFEGSEGEVGRAGAYEFITSYMPLPQVLDAALIENIHGTDTMTPEFILGELERYWEPVFGDYTKKPGSAGIVPMKDRPYYWTLISDYLNFNPENADWRSADMRPVVIEFTVSPSEGARGADLSDIRLKNHTNDPRIDEAIIYGLNRWVYYNNTDHPVKGRITYRFER